MIFPKHLSDAAETVAFFKDWKGRYVDVLYNLGGACFDEAPLILISRSEVFTIYYSDFSLYIDRYEKAFYLAHLERGIFRYEPSPYDFYYVSPAGDEIRSVIERVSFQTVDILGQKRVRRVSFHFKNGETLVIEGSDLVPGTMDAYLESDLI